MIDTHYMRRVKLLKDTKTDKYQKLLLSYNAESKAHIVLYKKKYEESKLRLLKEQQIKEQEQQRWRENSMNKVHDRETSGSKVRGSLNRDLTPNKMGEAALGSNPMISAGNPSIQNMRQGVRNIKTPQSSQQNQ